MPAEGGKGGIESIDFPSVDGGIYFLKRRYESVSAGNV